MNRIRVRRIKSAGCVWLAAICILQSTSVTASFPAWWVSRGVIPAVGSRTNDYAAANAGQVKWFAVKACEELNANLEGGAGGSVEAVVASFSLSNNYATVNAGQLKHIARPFYDRLIAAGLTNGYPWSETTADDQSFSVVNIGQVKNIFNFTLFTPGRDADFDGMQDWWEARYGLRTTPVTNGLVALWRFEEDGGLSFADSSGAGNTASVTNSLSPMLSVRGFPSGNALWFDGSNSLSVEESPSLNMTSAVTVAAWVFRDSYNAYSRTLISKGRINGARSYYATVNANGTVCFYVNNQAGLARVCTNWVSPAMLTGRWFHVAGICDGTNLVCYVNGIPGQKAPFNGTSIYPTTNGLSIGAGISGIPTRYPWVGGIADLSIYNRALSSNEVAALVECLGDPDEDGLKNSDECLNGSDPGTLDSDGDGYGDGWEVSHGSQPADAASFPAAISCVVSSASALTGGVIRVCVSTNAAGWDFTHSAVGASCVVSNVPTLRSYTIKAFMDLNSNGVCEAGESWGAYTGSPVRVNADLSGIGITLSDPDSDGDGLPDWWELRWFGSLNPQPYSDPNLNGTNNLAEYLNGTDPCNGVWVQSLTPAAVEVGWRADSAGIAGYAFTLKSNGVTVVDNVSCGGVESRNLTVSAMSTAVLCAVTVNATNGTGALLWSGSTSWRQPSNTMAGCTVNMLFPALGPVAVTNGPVVLASREVTVDNCWGFDRFYISGSPTGGVFSLANCRLEVELEAVTNRLLTGFDFAGGVKALDITQDGEGVWYMPEGRRKLTFSLRATNGVVSVNAPLYLLQWRPGASADVINCGGNSAATTY